MFSNSVRKKHEEILKLIALYRSHPCLWDSNTEGSKSLSARRIALDEIAQRLNASSEDVRKKLHNLRSQYRRENVRMRRLKTNRPKWLYYNALKFLNPTIKNKQTTIDPLASLNNGKRSNFEVGVGNLSDEIDVEVEDENTNCEKNHFRHTSSESSTKKEAKQISLPEDKTKFFTTSMDTSKRIIVIPHQDEQQDEYEVFGENVANELRSLESNKSLQNILKCTILQAILDINRAACDNVRVQESYTIEEAHLEDY